MPPGGGENSASSCKKGKIQKNGGGFSKLKAESIKLKA